MTTITSDGGVSPLRSKSIAFSPKFGIHPKRFSFPGLSSSFSSSSGDEGSGTGSGSIHRISPSPGNGGRSGSSQSSSSNSSVMGRSSPFVGGSMSTRQLRRGGSGISSIVGGGGSSGIIVSNSPSNLPSNPNSNPNSNHTTPVATPNTSSNGINTSTTATITKTITRESINITSINIPDDHDKSYDGGDEGQSGFYGDEDFDAEPGDEEEDNIYTSVNRSEGEDHGHGDIHVKIKENLVTASTGEVMRSSQRQLHPPQPQQPLQSSPINIPPSNKPSTPPLTARPPSCNDIRIIKSGWLHKRGKRKNWIRKWFVLRDHQLTCYKDEREYKADFIISTADIMSAAMLSDQRKKPNHFAIFTSNQNLHLRADNRQDAEDWVEVVRQTANDVCEDTLTSSFQRMGFLSQQDKVDNLQVPQPKYSSTSPLIDSGTDGFSSDGGAGQVQDKNSSKLGLRLQTEIQPNSLSQPQLQPLTENQQPTSKPPLHHINSLPKSQSIPKSIPSHLQNQSQSVPHSHTFSPYSPPIVSPSELFANVGLGGREEHIIQRGYILRLKKYNQWRKQWLVLTNHRLIFYKHEDLKGGPIKLIPLGDLLDVVDIDPLSKSKIYCMQIITPKKRLRFCAFNEEDLTNWMATLKSLIR